VISPTQIKSLIQSTCEGMGDKFASEDAITLIHETGVVESGYRKNMQEKEAKDLVIQSIRSAINRDSASGDGIDLLILDDNGIREESFKN